MIKLLYTGASEFDQPQIIPYKSLGGFISNSNIPNGSFNNLFDNISTYSIWNTQGKEYRVIAIKNEFLATLTGLKVWFEYPNDGESEPTNTNICEFRIAYALPTADDCGDLLTEILPTTYSQPYTVTLVGATDEENALSLPDLESGDYICLFIERKISSATREALSTDDLVAIDDGTVTLSTTEDISLKISYT